MSSLSSNLPVTRQKAQARIKVPLYLTFASHSVRKMENSGIYGGSARYKADLMDCSIFRSAFARCATAQTSQTDLAIWFMVIRPMSLMEDS